MARVREDPSRMSGSHDWTKAGKELGSGAGAAGEREAFCESHERDLAFAAHAYMIAGTGEFVPRTCAIHPIHSE